MPGRSIDGLILAMSFSIFLAEGGFLKTVHLEVQIEGMKIMRSHAKLLNHRALCNTFFYVPGSISLKESANEVVVPCCNPFSTCSVVADCCVAVGW